MVVVGGYYNYVFVGSIFDSLLYSCVFVFVQVQVNVVGVFLIGFCLGGVCEFVDGLGNV